MIDLSCWNLTIPIGATVISTAKLNSGYQDPFFKQQSDGALTFEAPSSGTGIKPTKNSKYPRSELRETNRDGTLAWWIPGEGLVTLYADLQVDSLASDLKGIFGQFHGKGTNVPLKVNITGSTVYLQLRPKYTPDDIEDGHPDYPEDKLPILKNYKLGTRLTYKVELDEQMRLNAWVNGNKVVTDYQFDMASYREAYKGEGDRWYAKAGVYSQTAVGKQGVGRATFHALSITHGKSQADQPEASAPAVRTLATLTNEVAQLVDKFKAGTLTAQDAGKSLQDLKLEADNAFPKGAERSAFYELVADAKSVVKGQAVPETPATTPAPSEPSAPAGGETIKDKLSEMEDVLDDLPDAAVAKLRQLIDDVRGMVA